MIPALLDGYDWREAFQYASAPSAVLGSNPSSLEGFCREDVETVIALSEGEPDELSWVFVGKLRDGRYAVLRAGCDYTGWDCQADGRSEVSDDLHKLIRFGLEDEERRRLGFTLTGRSPADKTIASMNSGLKALAAAGSKKRRIFVKLPMPKRVLREFLRFNQTLRQAERDRRAQQAARLPRVQCGLSWLRLEAWQVLFHVPQRANDNAWAWGWRGLEKVR